jgi:hypothetical protein
MIAEKTRKIQSVLGIVILALIRHLIAIVLMSSFVISMGGLYETDN